MIKSDSKIVIAISDIHGCYTSLVSLLNLLKKEAYWSNAGLVFLGDYIDRGNRGREVLSHLKKLLCERKNTYILLGNHEYYILKNSPWNISGIHSFCDEFKDKVIKQEYIDFISKFKLFLELGCLVFSHTGMPRTEYSFHNVSIEELMNCSGVSSRYQGPKLIYGHTPCREVIDSRYSTCIDTGISIQGYGQLTAAVFDANTGVLLKKLSVNKRF